MAIQITDGKLLIIESDQAMTVLLQNLLSPYQREIYTAGTGHEGVTLANQIKPDMMIVDLVLPDIDGLTLCRQLRAMSDSPILALSVIDKPAMLEQVLEAGADDYLVKPVSNNTLIAHLNNLARRRRTNLRSLPSAS